MTTKRRRKRLKSELVDTQPDETKLSLRMRIKPKTDNQEVYVKAMVDNEIVLCTGPAGSGKSLLAVNFACVALVQGSVDKIIVTRPMVNCGQGLGWLSGDLDNKFHPYASPIIEAMNDILGSATFNRLLKEKIIEIIPLELCRGKNFHKCVVIADEMQNASYAQLKMILSRHGQGTRTILAGDGKQTDLYFNDFALVIEKLDNIEGVGIVKLEYKDIQRSGIIAKILEKLD